MAKVVITIDTEEKTVSANVGGKVYENVCSFSTYCYSDMYSRNKEKSVSWNMQIDNETDDDDFKSYTNFCSAAELEQKKNSKAKFDIDEYFDKAKKRK